MFETQKLMSKPFFIDTFKQQCLEINCFPQSRISHNRFIIVLNTDSKYNSNNNHVIFFCISQPRIYDPYNRVYWDLV